MDVKILQPTTSLFKAIPSFNNARTKLQILFPYFYNQSQFHHSSIFFIYLPFLTYSPSLIINVFQDQTFGSAKGWSTMGNIIPRVFTFSVAIINVR